MKIVWDLVRKASACCRRERTLNGKRMHPTVSEDQNQTSETQDTQNLALEAMEADILNKNLPPLIESLTFVPNEGETQLNIDCQPSPNSGIDASAEVRSEGSVQDEHSEKTKDACNLNVCQKRKHSDGEATSAGDGAVFSSEDSENDDHELDGEPQKKRKLNTDGAKEEDRITQEWDNDMKLIRRNLGRISRLFEVYDGYRDKKIPSTINSDLIIHESVTNEQENVAGNNQMELAKLQASLVILSSPSKVLGRQQMMGSAKKVMEVVIQDEQGENSTKPSISYDQVIDVTNSTKL